VVAAPGGEELERHGQQAEAQETLSHGVTPFRAAVRGFRLPAPKFCAGAGCVQPAQERIWLENGKKAKCWRGGDNPPG
jgi:hypothetical protein